MSSAAHDIYPATDTGSGTAAAIASVRQYPCDFATRAQLRDYLVPLSNAVDQLGLGALARGRGAATLLQFKPVFVPDALPAEASPERVAARALEIARANQTNADRVDALAEYKIEKSNQIGSIILNSMLEQCGCDPSATAATC